MGETRQNALKQLTEEKRQVEAKIEYPFHPEINHISKKIMEKQDEDPLSRTYNWHSQKLEKINQMAELLKEKEEENFKTQTAPLNCVNPNVFAVSKVKQFVDSYRNESFTHSFKKNYQGQVETRGLSPVHQRSHNTGPTSKSLGKKPIVSANTENLMNYINLVQKDPNAKANIISKKLEFEVI